MFNGLKYKAALPLTSGNAEVLDIKTGHLFFIASRDVSPKTQYELKI